MNGLKIHYLYNSGFCVETENNILIFDYYNDKGIEDEKSIENGVIGGDLLTTGKRVYIFVSHSHYDHFNSLIFEFTKLNSSVKYILSSDVESVEEGIDYLIVKKGETIKLDNLIVKVYGSTDQGVSFLVNCDDFKLFHAGDLNWWHWKEDSAQDNQNAEKWFKEEIELIKGEKIDVAFFPVDGRQEEYYYLGGKYFIENLKPKVFIPMHFRENFEITKEFKNKMNASDTKIYEIPYRGFKIEI
ncbi:MBL fold metallo-hydrolase [Clostridium sp. P21]|uniref:MBL fold metallo-hydrolase n=1 Tax=Clostridium muellerianum TaxID=2716538 RepID=A0A7Y0ELR4_9CLOT|nr:MBL fold metallo-hydrolase [Clostridium muellerianum]NMM65799.1 MBL fold metallo-hydrolase [Clostridium muellerianum]